LKAIERQGMRETAHRAMQKCGQIFRYAVASGCAARDITVDLRGVLAPAIVRNRAAVTEPQEIGALLRALTGSGKYLIQSTRARPSDRSRAPSI
jgi:hypothetical protein